MESIYDVLKKTKEAAVYGAGVVAYNIAAALKAVYKIDILCYFVSEPSGNRFFGGIQAEVYSEEKFNQYKKPLLLVATPEQYHEEIVKRLSDNGGKPYYLVDASVEYELMKQFFHQRKSFLTVEDIPESGTGAVDGGSFEVYMARSVWDKPLRKTYKIPDWTIPVHAGSKLTEQRLSDDTDDFDGGISERNRNYCELTVTYWAWKKRRASYMGICHYRRIFALSEQDIAKIIKNDVDVILPMPFLCAPDASEQYFRYIAKSDYDVFMEIISKLYRERQKEIIQILHSDYFYNYNMLIAKESVFQRYCEFMFPVLFEMENYFKQKEIQRRDRYLGYFGELLTTIFFSLHKKDLKIVHTKKQWLV